jgi:hypothetical protein
MWQQSEFDDAARHDRVRKTLVSLVKPPQLAASFFILIWRRICSCSSGIEQEFVHFCHALNCGLATNSIKWRDIPCWPLSYRIGVSVTVKSSDMMLVTSCSGCCARLSASSARASSILMRGKIRCVLCGHTLNIGGT